MQPKNAASVNLDPNMTVQDTDKRKTLHFTVVFIVGTQL